MISKPHSYRRRKIKSDNIKSRGRAENMTFAKEISEKFMQHTTSVKIEECSKMIALIQNKLR